MAKQIDGKKLLEQAKNKVKQKEKVMNKNSNKKTIIVTVILTIVAIATIAGLLTVGFFLGRSYEKGINAEVSSQVKEMASVVSKEVQQ
jgi:hypothetical protein